MISDEQARRIASDYVTKLNSDWVIVDFKEYEFGWVFVFQATDINLDDDEPPLDMLFGNGPVIIDRNDGSVHPRGSTRRREEYIEEFQQNWRKTAGV